MCVCRLVWVLLNFWTGCNNTSRLCMFAGSFGGFWLCGLGVILRAVYIRLPVRLGAFEFMDWGLQYEPLIFVCRLVWELLKLWTGGFNTSRLYLFSGSFGSL